MDFYTMIENLSRGQSAKFPKNATTLDYARQLDNSKDLFNFRDQFRIPTKSSLKRKAVSISKEDPVYQDVNHISNGTKHTNGVNGVHNGVEKDSTSVYFCGNSLGCQPKRVPEYLATHLQTWADHGVNGHFSDFEESPLTAWQDMAESCAKKSANIVGADASEVVIMNTLTANLHLLMASFYRPNEKRHKIICEWKPFPSDYVSSALADLESLLTWK
jgi:kynureninase